MTGSGRTAAGALGRAAGLGVLAGLRSATPLAVIVRATASGQFRRLERTPLRLLRSARARRLAPFMAGGEWIVDKLPFVPSRIASGPLLGRAMFGGLVGAVSALDAERPVVPGLIAGSAGAIVGSFGGYRCRVWLGRRLKVADPLIGSVEDVLALGGTRAVLRIPWLGYVAVICAGWASLALREGADQSAVAT